MKTKSTYKPIDLVNKKARFEFEFVSTYIAGIQLYGTEIKSIREGKVNLTDGYCYFKKAELWVKNLHISEYNFGTYNNHEPERLRKLLLHKKELKKLESSIKEKGLTIIPFRIFINERGLAKLEIALARGKKLHDKRNTIKERDSKMDLHKALKSARMR